MSLRAGGLLLGAALLTCGCDGAKKRDAAATASAAAPASSSSAPAPTSPPPLALPSTAVVPETARCAKGATYGPRKIGDELGGAVAAAGDLVVAGAARREREDGGLGAALVLRRSGATCTLEAELREKGLRLGNAVATDGQSVFVDALFDGAVLVFEKKDGTWVRTQRIEPNPGKKIDMFGRAIVLEGGTLVIGASGGEGVFVYERQDGIWKLAQALLAESPAPGKSAGIHQGAFGASLALEGETLAVSEPFISGPQKSNGAVHVYKREGARWIHKARLISADPMKNEELGTAIALSGDTLAALANLPERRGGVVLFKRDGDTWSQRMVIVAPQDIQTFAGTLAMRGRTLYLGTEGSHDSRGAVLEYELLDGDDYRLVRTLTLDPASPTAFFGASLAIAGPALLVGAQLVDDRAGGVYLLSP